MTKEDEISNSAHSPRPLASFAVFGYNQESYIEASVQAALSQDYSPLEIILSDDCSSDGTFEKMKECASRYSGSHSILVNRTSKNIGTIDHLISVARMASGKYLIVSAGDDVSLPQRTSELVEIMERHQARAAYSACKFIDGSGVVIQDYHFPEPLPAIQEIFSESATPKRYAGYVRNIPGYSAAYSRDFFAELPYTENGALNEDALSTFLLNFSGEEIAISKSALVLYRKHSGASSWLVNESWRDFYQREKKIVAFSQTRIKFYEYLRDTVKIEKKIPTETRILKSLERQYNKARVVCRSAEVGFWGRLKSLFRPMDAESRVYVVSRIFGIRAFACFRYLLSVLKFW